MTRLALLLALTSCSFTLVRGPDSAIVPPMVDTECTTSRAWPITDLVVAGLFVASGIAAIIEANSSRASKHSATAAISMLPFGIGFAVSSLVGFNRVGDCRDQSMPIEPL